MDKVMKKHQDGSDESSCWSLRSSLEKKLFVALGLAMISIIVISTLWAVQSDKPSICTSPSCVRSSVEILNFIDKSQNPCDDFYQFSCGGYLKNMQVTNTSTEAVDKSMNQILLARMENILEEPVKNQDPPAYNNAKKFYKSCMNISLHESEGFKTIKQLFQKIGGYPTLEGNSWWAQEYDWKSELLKLAKMGIDTCNFFCVHVAEDEKPPYRYIVEVRTPRFSARNTIDEDRRNRLLDFLEDVAVYYGAQVQAARKDSQDVLEFVRAIGRIYEEADEMNDTSTYFSVSELQYKYPSMRWEQFLYQLLGPDDRITYEDQIKVLNPIYLKKLEIFLNSANPRTLSNFLSLEIVSDVMEFLPEEMHRKVKILEGVSYSEGRVEPHRSQICSTFTHSLLQPVVNALYLEKYYNEEDRAAVLNIVNSLKNNYKTTIRNYHWIDTKTQQSLQKKLISLQFLMATKSDIPRIGRLDDYAKVQVSEDKYLESALNIKRLNREISMQRLRKSLKDEAIPDFIYINGMKLYNPVLNQIELPSGLLGGLYFQRARPACINYGALGSIIGAEISHVLTKTSGWDFDVRSSWSIDSISNYQEKLDCLENRFDKFTVLELGENLNSTKSYLMSRLIGTKLAYKSYLEWIHKNDQEEQVAGIHYTPKQLFWISTVLPYCTKFSTENEDYIKKFKTLPISYKVNRVLENIEDFTRDFHCPRNSNMNPSNKCLL